MKKAVVILFSIIVHFYANILFAQDNRVVDSLLFCLDTTIADTAKINLLNSISEVYLYNNPEESKKFANKALLLSEANNYKIGVAKSNTNLCTNAIVQSEYKLAIEYCKKSMRIYEDIDDQRGIEICLSNLSVANSHIGNYSQAIDYSKKALIICKALRDSLGASKCLMNIGLVYAYQSNYPVAIDYLKKGLIICEEFGDKDGVSTCLNNIGVIYNYQGNHSKSIEYQEKSLNVCRELGNKTAISSRLINLGVSYDDQSNYDKAIDCYEKALVIKIELGDKIGIANCFNNIGEVFIDKGNYAEAIEYYEKAIKLYKELDDKEGISICLMNIGKVHFQQDYYEIAIEYYEKSMAIVKNSPHKRVMANVLNNIGELYIKQKKYQLAIIKFEKAITISDEIGDDSELAKSVYFIGKVFLKQGNYYKAINEFEKAIKLHDDLGEDGKIAVDLIKIGDAWFGLGNYNKAIGFSEKGLKIAQKIESKEQLRMAYEVLSKSYAKKNEFQKAYLYSILFKQIHDSIFTLESQKQINVVENRFEIERNLQEIEIQQIKLDKQAAEIKQHQILQNAFFGVFIAVLIIAVLIVIGYLRVHKANITIKEQNDQIELKNSELNHSNEELRVNLETINQQKEVIENTNKEITDSIYYAKYIQEAILLKRDKIKKLLHDYFVFYKPKDIVSGDFYWVTEVDRKIIVAAADCTGHGVPGGFMSMLGISFLNEIVNKEYITHTGVILRRLRKEVIDALQQKGFDGEQSDGIDMGICSIDFNSMELQFSGANAPLYIVRAKNKALIQGAIAEESENNILYEIKGDNMPIALFKRMNKFKAVELKIQKGDCLYMFSDGFADQFGGSDGQRFKYKAFKQLILSICYKPMKEQKLLLKKELATWQQNYEQIDDILIMGILV